MPTRSRLKADRPVALLAGLARLAARPLPTGSVASAKTIGIVTVACFAASAGPVAQVTIRSTFALANSVAISAARSFRPSAHRASIWRLRPSVQPSSPSRCTRTESHCPPTAEVDAPRNRVSHSLLLRVRRQRPRHRRTAEQRDKPAPLHHSITLSARSTSSAGTSCPIALRWPVD